MGELNERVKREKYQELWELNCRQLVEYDAVLVEKDEAMDSLRRQLVVLQARSASHPRPVAGSGPHAELPTLSHSLGFRSTVTGTHSDVRPALASGRHGKALPVDPFDGENQSHIQRLVSSIAASC